MCGILGYSGKRVEPNFMEYFFLANEHRGRQATGYYTPPQGIVKYAQSAEDFLKNPKVKLVSVGHLFLGHTRQGTQGANTDDNAHPFQKGNIIGIHNGVIWNDHTLCKEHGFPKCEVDSEIIFEMINSFGVQGLKEIHGCIAIAWHDRRKKNSLYLYRRDNPIWIGYDGDGELYFSSVEQPLRALKMTGIGMLKPDVVFEFIDGKLVSQVEIPYTRPSYAYGSQYRNWNGTSSYGEEEVYAGVDNYHTAGYWKNGTFFPYNRSHAADNYQRGRVGMGHVSDDDRPGYRPDTLADRKAKSKDENKEKFLDNFEKSGKKEENKKLAGKQLQIESGRTANAFTEAKPAKELKDSTQTADGRLAGGENSNATSFHDEMIQALSEAYEFITGIPNWYDTPTRTLLEKRLRRILF